MITEHKNEEAREAVGFFEKLVADFPEVQEYREKLANAYFDLGNVLKDAGRLDGAEEAYRSAEAIRLDGMLPKNWSSLSESIIK
jgi:tetratricopeptide (TPR) repeat protein